jgi:signal transduction histidine kinase
MGSPFPKIPPTRLYEGLSILIASQNTHTGFPEMQNTSPTMPVKKIILPTEIDLDLFISTEAHDLRTPFNHITGFSKMLLNTVADAPLTEFQKEDLGTVYRSGMRALTLLNGLIDIARINRQEKGTYPKDIDIEQLIAQGLAQWKKFNPGADVQVDYQVLSSIKTICADELLNRQVISGFVAYVALFCETKAAISITVSDEPGWFLFTFASAGVKAHLPSEMDQEMFGFINRTLIEMQKGEIRQAEETEDGAIIRFVLPKNKTV